VRHEEVAERFGVLAMPQIFVYDAGGKLVELFSGETSPGKIRSAIP
jgi:thioredoxin-related protein